MNIMQTVLMTSLGMLNSDGSYKDPIDHFLPEPKPKKPCIHCGDEHTHNNAFCSAKCCKEYRK